MNARDLLAGLENKTGEEFLLELSVRTYQEPLSRLREQQLLELPTALRVPMRENVPGLLQLYTEGNREALLQAIGAYVSTVKDS